MGSRNDRCSGRNIEGGKALSLLTAAGPLPLETLAREFRNDLT
ncbi:MAG: hypothetical protein ABSF46_09820 [Terriglobia bacterium]